MKRSITAAAAAVLSVALFASGAYAAQTEMQMVEDTAMKLLLELNLPTDNLDNLSVAQLRQIISIADSKEMGDGTRGQVQKILEGN